MLLGIKWYQFVRNDDVRRALTKLPKLTAIIQSRQLTLFWRQCRCQEDPVSLPSGRLEKTTRSSLDHVAQHRPTGSETTLPYAPRSSRFGSEPLSVEDDVDVWRYAILSCMPETTTMTLDIKHYSLLKAWYGGWGGIINTSTLVLQTEFAMWLWWFIFSVSTVLSQLVF